jgi:PEP-CTERM motif
MLVRRLLSGLFLSAGIAATAHAAPILSTMGNVGDLTKSLSTVAAESFVLASGTGISEIEIALGRASAANGSIIITINSDNGSNKPGSVLDTVATLSESLIGTTEGFYNFFNLPINDLTAGVRYWVQVAKVGTVSTSVYTTTAAPSPNGAASASATIAAGNTNYYPGLGPSKTSILEVMCLSADNSCASTFAATLSFDQTPTPEPASLAIVGVGLAGIGWIRRRKSGGPKQPSAN